MESLEQTPTTDNLTFGDLNKKVTIDVSNFTKE